MVQEKVEMEEQQTSLEAELTIENIQGDRSEEDRLTEAEKNERQRKMLQVWYMNYANSVTRQASYIEFFLAGEFEVYDLALLRARKGSCLVFQGN